jgi:ethanolamine permease
VSATLNFNLAITAIAFVTIFVLLFATRFYSPSESLLQLSRLSNGLPLGWLGVMGALQFAIWFYLGIEGTALAAEECRSTSRALPIGAIVGTITLLIGASVTWLVCSSLVDPKTLGVSDYPLFDAAQLTRNPLVIDALFAGTVLACLASANGCITDASRAWFAMSRDTLIPEEFSRVHPRFKTPYRAIVFFLPIAVAFGYAGLLDQVITFSILSALIVYLFSAIMMFKFRRMYPLGSIERGFTAPMHPVPAVVLLVLAAVTLAGMYFGYWQNLVAGVLFYFIASMWFVLHRYKFMDPRKFISVGANHWPRPKGY